MKISVFVQNMNNGGVERFASLLTNYLAEKGYDVSIVMLTSKDVFYKLNNRIELKSLIVLNGKRTILKEIKAMLAVLMYLRKDNSDCIIALDDSVITVVALACFLLGKRLIVSERNDPSVYKKKLFVFARNLAYSIAETAVFQTEDAMNFFSNRIRKHSVIIPNPLTRNLPYRKDSHNNDILMACRLRPQKNVDMAIDAFRIFQETHKQFRLVICGTGELENSLKDKAQQLGISENVIFEGHVTDVHERLRECAMYLSTSDFEGISNSMLEALAIGAPSICTDCPVGGARMFIKNMENGILVPIKETKPTADAMTLIADNEDIANEFSRNSVKIREELSEEVIFGKWIQLICRS